MDTEREHEGVGTGQLGVGDNAVAGITALRLKEFPSTQVQAWVAGGLAFGWPGATEEQRQGCCRERGVLRALAWGLGGRGQRAKPRRSCWMERNWLVREPDL